MSGPKSADYGLSAAERARIAEQQRLERERREEERRVQLEKEAKEDLLERLRLHLSGTEKEVTKMEKLEQRTGSSYDVLEETKRTISRLKDQAKAAESSEGKNSSQLHAENEELRKALNLLATKTEECFTTSSQAAKEFHEQLDKTIECGFVLSYNTVKAAKDEKERELKKEIQRINRLLSGFDPADMPERLIKKFQKFKKQLEEEKDADNLKDLCTLFIEPFLDECEAYRELRRRFETLLVTYYALCRINNIVPEKFECSEKGIAALEAQISELEEIDLEVREAEKIYEALEKVMAEMGYDLYGERDTVKNGGKRIIHHQLYTIGEDTVLDVYFEDNGQISMQVGKGDDLDRQPMEAEIPRLIEMMKSFCGDYSKIEERLKELGIEVNCKSRKPATKEYAQIINKKDYNTSQKGQGTQKEATQERAKGRRAAKKGQAAKKYMHAE